MKKLSIISEGKNTGVRFLMQLEPLIGKYVELENILLSEIDSNNIISDLILFTAEYVRDRAMMFLDASIPYLVAQRVIDYKNIEEIISIKNGEHVLLVNDNHSTSKKAIDQLLELGLDHIKYYPYYPGCISYPELEIIITPGESQLIPYTPKKLIDINTRILDIKSIHDIFYTLGIEQIVDQSLVTNYIRDIVKISKSIDESREKIEESEKILEVIVDSLDYGIGFIDHRGEIIRLNSKFEYILGKRKKDILNKNIKYFFPNNEIEKLGEFNKIIEIENRLVSIETRKVNSSSKFGYIIYLKNIEKTRKVGCKDEIRDIYTVNRKLHNFNDYLSVDDKVGDMISRAKKFSKTEYTILIEGENGTGKEILAQGIHMNSYRRNNIFIPINMTTISSNLLESELFGYEEGTFTGAIKGGKIGLFQMGDGGTIFIDEIGDTPLDVQSKLLRVLEEKRIRKVGGIQETSIDVRIIAATNKDLLELVERGEFRLDLFFRLNILPIHTIPLRNRKDDINYLLKHFINISLLEKINSLEDFFQIETIEFLNNYKWIGNVRELINLVEYLILIYEGEKLSTSLLHPYMRNMSSKQKNLTLNRDEIWVLNKLDKSGEVLGRNKLKQIAINEKVDIGEGKIRRIIDTLKRYELIDSIKNQGCKINIKGKDILDK